ncbi:hypothetical protein O6H91_11G089300 [Diphasiastrum complanatum]|uniref:Uncharacterized protein n=1 Tax=Diphasiastrum complanatum TaxID=34168 RepID=A0ACC2CBG0_DIPCM|nr:hypothetical protein O6H91_Y085300 [Diphasiastrum complanatum]KAJ7539366.1 hypothetical protein O6H91_11G089300 [Diphasiastrum complanatum]
MKRLAMSRFRPWYTVSLRSIYRISNGSVINSCNGPRKGIILPNPTSPCDAFHTFSEMRIEATRLQKAAASEQEDFDPTEHRTPPSEKIHRLADEIASLTLLEVTDLSSLIKKKLGLPNMPMGMPMMMPGMMPGMMPAGEAAPQAEEKEPEKTAFDVKLEKYDAAAKIKIIKEVRTFTALGLKEAKELVEKTPALLKKGVSKEEALQIVEKIKAAGGTAVME